MDARKTEYILGKRIIAQSGAANAERLLQCDIRQAVLGEVPVTAIRDGGYVLIDFGRELQGGLHYVIQQTSKRRAMMRVVFGESAMEAMSSIGEKNATNDHAPRDMTIEIAALSSQRIGNTGFRFVKIEAVGNDIELRSAQAVFEYIDLQYRGSFTCDNDTLNKIWKVGAYTVHLNIQEYIWDGIKRDRLVWIGDMHPEISTISAVFGNIETVRRSLDLIRESTPEGQWMNGFPSYTMWWIVIQRDWYMYTGDKEYLLAQKKYLMAAAERIAGSINENGASNLEPPFVDWSSNGKPEAYVGFQAMLILSLDAAAEIFGVFGETELREKCLEAKNRAKDYLPGGAARNKQMAALAALAGLISHTDAAAYIEKDGAHGLSSFLGFYTLQALAEAGKMDSALELIQAYWGKMIEFGATTFWEDFDIEWTKNAVPIDMLVPEGKDDIHGDFGRFCYEKFRHSLCHGWASGPTAFLSKHVLGITAIEPGFRTVRIRPDLGGLKWAKGTYPTPYGDISVSHEVVNGSVKTAIDAPPEITIVE